MAIPEGRMSTEPVPANYLVPDDKGRNALIDYELGPKGLSDISEGSRFQNWSMTYVAGDFVLTPETIGSPITIINVADVQQMSFTFDQNGNIAIIYIKNDTEGYLYWFDPVASAFVTWALPDPIYGAMLSLDDKRTLQSAANDDLLWYTRKIGAQYNLYQRIQRERFTVEHLMAEAVYAFITQAGMHKELRGQIKLSTTFSISLDPPPVPAPIPSKIYVATNGNDGNPGTEALPLLTLEASAQAVRNEKTANGMGDGIEVILRGGTYERTSSLALTSADSGETGNPVVWKSYPSETPRIVGSQALDPVWFNLMTSGDAEWARVPVAARGNVMICDLGAHGITDYGLLKPRGSGSSASIAPMELFADNQPLQLARWPKPGQNFNVQHGLIGEGTVEIVGPDNISPDVRGTYIEGTSFNGKGTFARDGLVDGVQYYLWYRYNPLDGIQYTWILSDEVDANNGTARWFNYGTELLSFKWAENGAVGYPSANAGSIMDGWVFIADPTAQPTFDVMAPIADRLTNWQTAPDLWLQGYWGYYWYDWMNSATADDVNDTLTMFANPVYGMKPGYPFYAMNLLEELSEAGEYYLERSSGILYYWPDGNILTQDLQVTMLQTPVLEITGSDITFDGLNIGMNRYHAIRNNIASDSILFKNCEIYGPNIDAAWMDGTNSGFSRCTIRDTGANGVRLNAGDRAALTDGGSFMENCEVYNTGRWTICYSSPVRLKGCGNRASHNYFHDLRHAAVLYNGNEHLIEYNNIENVVTAASDAGAIYGYHSWGYRGNVIKNNWIHGVGGLFDPESCHGIYHDGFVSATNNFGNYISDVTGRGIFCNGGRDQLMDNNIIWRCHIGYAGNDALVAAYDPTPGAHNNMQETLNKTDGVDYKSEPWQSAYPEVYAIPTDQTTIVNGTWTSPENCVLSRNLFWDNEIHIKADQTDTLDFYAEVIDNISGFDPLFVNEAGGDLNLLPESPAFTIPGWVDIVFDDIGIKPLI